MTRTALLGVLTLVGVVISTDSPSVVFADDDHRGKTFKVTVTNITRGVGGMPTDSGQILNGLVVATHNRNFRLFELGQPVSEELALVAEDALNRDLFDALSADRNVCDVQTIGIVDEPPGTIYPILPGASASVIITVKGRCRYLSLAAMLVTTNDAFAALNGVRLYKRSDYAVAYDAGSEANTENCDHIPGPPCGNVNSVGGGEGYVSIHSGIHGTGGGVASSDLNPSNRDWRNPVAYITIDRVDDHDHDDDDD